MLSTLQQHQSEFSKALIYKQSASNRFARKIKKTSNISPQLALEIYRNNTRGARVNALKSIFPMCRKILGEETFYSIARHYAGEDKEGTADLNNYGKSLDLHLALIISAGRLSSDYSYLPDLARLEFKLHAAYYAANDPVFPFKLFNNRIENDKRVYFITAASLALMTSQYPVYEIWKHFSEKHYINTVKPIKRFQHLLISRSRYKPEVTVTHESVYNTLKSIINGSSLQEIAENTHHNIDKVLPVLIVNKWVVGIR